MSTQIKKHIGFKAKKADPAADIALINQHALKTLTPEEVFCFSIVLCDNEVDRDLERFSDDALNKMAELFLGKTGISDHCWSADRQIARIYRTSVETPGEKTARGDLLKQLRACAYMLRTDETKPLIDAIEGGIMKEVSVALGCGKATCSICGSTFSECEHRRGAEYDGKLCHVVLADPLDAYEFSFVAVPAQPGAGVTKSAKDVTAAFDIVLGIDLADYPDQTAKLETRLKTARLTQAERNERAAIAAAAQKYL